MNEPAIPRSDPPAQSEATPTLRDARERSGRAGIAGDRRASTARRGRRPNAGRARMPRFTPLDPLRSAAQFMVLAYGTIAVAHWFVIAEPFRWVLIASATLTVACALRIALLEPRLGPDARERALGILALLLSANALLHLGLAQDSLQSTNVAVAIVAAGVVLSLRWLWAAIVAMNWLGWCLIVWLRAIPDTEHFAFALALSTLLSWFVHLTRCKLIAQHRELETERDSAFEREERAMAATQAKSRFLANMSHELRTPLNGVLGMLELISRAELEREQRDHVDAAKHSADTLLHLIDDVLDFSRIEAKELTIEAEPFDGRQLFETFARDMAAAASDKGLVLKLAPGRLPTRRLVGDRIRLRRVLAKLTSNAIRFTHAGHVTISVQAHERADGCLLVIRVSDTGMGIAAGDRERIFEPFTQADTSSTRRYGGAGLGLALTRELCRLMGGDLTVTSRSGVGSTFTATVVLALEQAGPAPAPEEYGLRSALEGLRVLVVEDNEINREVTRALLRHLSIDVDTAEDGEQAIAMLRAPPRAAFDLVLMDCQMPVLDGVEATRRIRAAAAGAEVARVPIVALTANAMQGDRELCLAAGMDDFLTKPLDPAALERTIAQFVLEVECV